MKRIIFIRPLILTVIVMQCMVSCQDPLTRPLEFNSSITNGDIKPDQNGVYHVGKGVQLNFAFEGNADFISATYNIFNPAETSLSFITMLANWNDNKDNLRVYLSEDFPGLSLSNPKSDSALVNNWPWIDITEQCAIPTKRNTKDTSFVDMAAYKGKNIVLAFKYDGKSNSSIQPMFTLSKMEVRSVVTKTGEEIASTTAQKMQLQPFYAKGIDDSAYLSSTDGGCWDVSFTDPSDNTAVKIRQLMINQPVAESWLLTAPITIPRGKDEDGEAAYIKNVHTLTDKYSLTFTEPGEWTLRFYAANANYKYKESTQQIYKFIVE